MKSSEYICFRCGKLRSEASGAPCLVCADVVEGNPGREAEIAERIKLYSSVESSMHKMDLVMLRVLARAASAYLVHVELLGDCGGKFDMGEK